MKPVSNETVINHIRCSGLRFHVAGRAKKNGETNDRAQNEEGKHRSNDHVEYLYLS